MQQRTLDLAILLGAESALLETTGQAILAHRRLPHPLLNRIEDQFPREIARARFNAIWAARGDAPTDATVVAMQFREELTALFRTHGRLVEPYTLLIGPPARDNPS
jgi:hypothetical protein